MNNQKGSAFLCLCVLWFALPFQLLVRYNQERRVEQFGIAVAHALNLHLAAVFVVPDVERIEIAYLVETDTEDLRRSSQSAVRLVKGRTIVIIEDIVDSGRTMYGMVQKLKSLGVEDLRIATLFFKPEALQYDLNINYVAMEIPNDFIVGFGLDYDELGRNFKDIYTLVKE